MKIKINLNIKINRVIKFFILSDLLFLGGWSLVQPIFPIFIIKKIEGATLVSVGLVAGLYWLVKSLIQIPVANYLDKNDGEKDDFYALIFALTLAALASFSFSLVHQLWQLFLTQFLYAVAMGFYVPSWSGIFSRHLDEKRFSFDWSLDSTVVGLTSCLSAVLGGVLANLLGFSFVFLMVGVFSLLSAILIFSVPDLVLPKKTTDAIPPLMRDHSPSNINR
jgi:MFS family permease